MDKNNLPIIVEKMDGGAAINTSMPVSFRFISQQTVVA